jgi:hypothetical protein
MFVTIFFAPFNTIGAVRTTRTAEKLLKFGCDVQVISATDLPFQDELDTTFPKTRINATKWWNFDPQIRSFLRRKNNNTLEMPSHKKIKNAKMKLIFRRACRHFVPVPDKFVGWYFYAMQEAAKVIEAEGKPDVIYASASPYTSLIVARAISKKYSIPWVAELRDLWADNHYKPKGIVGSLLEKIILNSAASLVTVSEPLAEKLRKRYFQPIHVIYNSYDEADFCSPNPKICNTIKKIVYTGTVHSEVQDPTPLFQAFSDSLELRSKFIVEFYGYDLNEIEILANSMGLEQCVNFHGSISRKETLLKQQNADILLFLPWNDPLQKGILTGKLFEYIGAKRPILSIGSATNDATKIILDNNFGYSKSEPDEIRKLLLQNESFKNLRGKPEKFEREHQVKKLLDVLLNAKET